MCRSSLFSTAIVLVVGFLALSSCGQDDGGAVVAGQNQVPTTSATTTRPAIQPETDTPTSGDDLATTSSLTLPSSELQSELDIRELQEDLGLQSEDLEPSDPFENLNQVSSPMTTLCWVNREVTRHFLMMIGTEEEQQRISEAIDVWLIETAPEVVAQIESLLGDLPDTVTDFAEELARQLSSASEGATQRSDHSDIDSSPLLEMNYETLPAQEAYLDEAEKAGCEQPV